MFPSPLKILLLSGRPDEAAPVRDALGGSADPPFLVECAGRLEDGIRILADGSYQAVIMDLSLPDGRGLDAFLALRARAPEIPVVVLTGPEDGQLGRIAVREGAQECIQKGRVEGRSLARSVSYAIARHSLQEELHARALFDDLTGLYNRRGFLLLAEQHWKVAFRTARPFLVAFADLEGLRSINEESGHAAGDSALRKAAAVLRRTFRDSDILARLGGDEFAALAIEAPADKGAGLLARLRENLAADGTAGPALSMSAGLAVFDPEVPRSVDELLGIASGAARADGNGGNRP